VPSVVVVVVVVMVNVLGRSPSGCRIARGRERRSEAFDLGTLRSFNDLFRMDRLPSARARRAPGESASGNLASRAPARGFAELVRYDFRP